MRMLVTGMALAAMGSACVAGTVDYLEIENDVVLFSTSDSKTSTPACVDAASSDLWSVSLSSDSGRAMYSMILTAMAKPGELGLQVQTADDCAVSAGVERAGNVQMVSSAQGGSSSGGKSVGLYKSDGVTRVGTVIKMGSTSAWYYVTDELTREVQYYFIIDTDDYMYYDAPNCEGNMYYAHDRGLRSYNYLGGQYYETSSTEESYNMQSQLKANGTCQTANFGPRDGYRVTKTEHPVCGNFPCYVKED